MAAALLVVVLLQRYNGNHYYWIATGFSALFLLVGLIRPATVNGFQKMWLALGNYIGGVSTFVLLTAIYVLVFTPFSIVLRLFQIDALRLKNNTNTNTYWEDPESEFSSMTNQF